MEKNTMEQVKERPDQWPNVLKWSDPIGRVAFLGHKIFAQILLVTAFIKIDPEMNEIPPIAALLLVLWVLVSLSACSRRLADMGHNQWWSLLWFIPMADIILFVYLLFGRGSSASELS